MFPVSQHLPHVCVLNGIDRWQKAISRWRLRRLVPCCIVGDNWATTACHLESPGKGAETLLSRSLSLRLWGEEKPWAGQRCYLFRAWGLPGLVGLVGKSSPSRSYPSVAYLGTWQNTHCFVSPTQGSCMNCLPTDTVPSHPRTFCEKFFWDIFNIYIYLMVHLYNFTYLFWHRSQCTQASLKLI